MDRFSKVALGLVMALVSTSIGVASGGEKKEVSIEKLEKIAMEQRKFWDELNASSSVYVQYVRSNPKEQERLRKELGNSALTKNSKDKDIEEILRDIIIGRIIEPTEKAITETNALLAKAKSKSKKDTKQIEAISAEMAELQAKLGRDLALLKEITRVGPKDNQAAVTEKLMVWAIRQGQETTAAWNADGLYSRVRGHAAAIDRKQKSKFSTDEVTEQADEARAQVAKQMGITVEQLDNLIPEQILLEIAYESDGVVNPSVTMGDRLMYVPWTLLDTATFLWDLIGACFESPLAEDEAARLNESKERAIVLARIKAKGELRDLVATTILNRYEAAAKANRGLRGNLLAKGDSNSGMKGLKKAQKAVKVEKAEEEGVGPSGKPEEENTPEEDVPMDSDNGDGTPIAKDRISSDDRFDP